MAQGVKARLSPLQIYHVLLSAYGPQHWWPADTPFEVMVGAILTQNTSWTNVEKAITNLKFENLMDARHILDCAPDHLAEVIRPTGFYRQKATRLNALCMFYLEHGCEQQLRRWPATSLRQRMLKVHGIGPETADSILLYALNKPVFVIDAYTARIFSRLGMLERQSAYADTQAFFHARLPRSIPIFQEFHALIVAHAKRFCRSRPLCPGCPLAASCAYASAGNQEHDMAHEAQPRAQAENTTA